jgi:site-specific DNA recombinase
MTIIQNNLASDIDMETAAGTAAISAYLPSLEIEPINTALESGTVDFDEAGPGDEPGQAPSGTRAVLYLRVSSTGQVKTDYDPEGLSIPAQRSSCERKAEQLGLSIVGEYVEPGKSGTEMTKREAFQRMLERVRRDKDVDAVIVYELSRLARNRLDDAIVMADLRKRGVTLISATENIDATPVGQLMHGLLAAFNEYRSGKDGADIAYKMGEKARKGGTLGRAPIGYLNTIDRIDGRDVRSVSIEETRAPFVKLAFELYADGSHTIDQIADELADRGLTTKGNYRRAGGPVSYSKLAKLLRDPYYIGLVTYQGEQYQGRHDALISEALFNRVQELLDARGYAGERRRVNHHYLKRSLFCGRCWQAEQQVRRMIIQRAVGSSGREYFYFFCRGVQDHSCDAPYNNLQRVEEAVEEHYRSVAFTPDFITAMRQVIRGTLADSESAQRLLHQQLKDQLAKLSANEDNLLDLAADDALPQAKIRSRLREIEQQRVKLRAQLDTVTDDLSAGAVYLETCLRLLENPYELYLGASDETRRKLNQTIFSKLFIYNDEITGHEITEPLAELLSAQEGYQAQPEHGTEAARAAAQRALGSQAPKRRSATHRGGAPSSVVDDLLTSVRCNDQQDDGCSKTSMVRPARFELATS